MPSKERKPIDGMMKHGDLKAGDTRCNYCSQPSAIVIGKTPFCADHAEAAHKTAEDEVSLKGSAENLSTEFK